MKLLESETTSINIPANTKIIAGKEQFRALICSTEIMTAANFFRIATIVSALIQSIFADTIGIATLFRHDSSMTYSNLQGDIPAENFTQKMLGKAFGAKWLNYAQVRFQRNGKVVAEITHFRYCGDLHKHIIFLDAISGMEETVFLASQFSEFLAGMLPSDLVLNTDIPSCEKARGMTAYDYFEEDDPSPSTLKHFLGPGIETVLH